MSERLVNGAPDRIEREQESQLRPQNFSEFIGQKRCRQINHHPDGDFRSAQWPRYKNGVD